MATKIVATWRVVIATLLNQTYTVKDMRIMEMIKKCKRSELFNKLFSSTVPRATGPS